MTKILTAAEYPTYEAYCADRSASGHHVMPESLFTALKEDETLCNVRAEGY